MGNYIKQLLYNKENIRKKYANEFDEINLRKSLKDAWGIPYSIKYREECINGSVLSFITLKNPHITWENVLPINPVREIYIYDNIRRDISLRLGKKILPHILIDNHIIEYICDFIK